MTTVFVIGAASEAEILHEIHVNVIHTYPDFWGALKEREPHQKVFKITVEEEEVQP